MKRVVLHTMMIASLLLLGAVPALAGGADLLSELVQLADSKLSDQDLAAISGRGVSQSSGTVEPGRVIIWDEGPQGGISIHHSSTGYGATQISTVSLSGP